MNIPSFWLKLLKEAHDAKTLQLAKDVVSAYAAEAEAYALYEKLKNILQTWEIWGCFQAQQITLKYTEALGSWCEVINHLFNDLDDTWEVLGVERDVVKHACFYEQERVARLITTIMTQQQEWHTRYLDQSRLDEATTLFERREQEGHAEED